MKLDEYFTLVANLLKAAEGNSEETVRLLRAAAEAALETATKIESQQKVGERL